VACGSRPWAAAQTNVGARGHPRQHMVLQAAALGLLLVLRSACALAQERPGPSSAPAKAPGSEAPALHVDFPRCATGLLLVCCCACEQAAASAAQLSARRYSPQVAQEQQQRCVLV